MQAALVNASCGQLQAHQPRGADGSSAIVNGISMANKWSFICYSQSV